METPIYRRRGATRRDVIKTAAGVGLLASAGPFVHARPAHAARKTLKILQWSHFVPAYDKWFNNEYIKEWGDKNDTEVIVDNINLGLIPSRAAAEVSAQQGHDLVMFLSPPSVYEEQVVDMKDVYAECERKHGKPIDLAVKSTYNPKTKKYFAFSDSFVPDPVNYRSDLWGDIGMKPDTWDDIRVGGKKIKDKTADPGRHRALRRTRHRHGDAGDHVFVRLARAGRRRQPHDQLARRPWRQSSSSRRYSRRPRRRRCWPGIPRPTTGRCSPAGLRSSSTRSR